MERSDRSSGSLMFFHEPFSDDYPVLCWRVWWNATRAILFEYMYVRIHGCTWIRILSPGQASFKGGPFVQSVWSLSNHILTLPSHATGILLRTLPAQCPGIPPSSALQARINARSLPAAFPRAWNCFRGRPRVFTFAVLCIMQGGWKGVNQEQDVRCSRCPRSSWSRLTTLLHTHADQYI
jgi:hypothetical protein